jgi:hypothetical protein
LEPSRWSSVRQLREEAKKNRDPKLLALLSLLSTDYAERLRLSDEAIRKDASLTWLDFEHSYREWQPFKDHPDRRFLPVERIERLRKWDPDNAVPCELAAVVIQERLGAAWFDMESRYHYRASYNFSKAVLKAENKDLPALDSEWLAAMDKVFASPKYDSYATQQFELIRDVGQKYGIRDPDITLYVLARSHLPNLLSLRIYTSWLLNQSVEAEQRGDTAGATTYAWKALHFAQRMHLGKKTTIEGLIAIAMGKMAGERLQPLLEKHGQANEASLIAFQLAEWQSEAEQRRFLTATSDRGTREAVAWAGMTIWLATVVILFTGVMSCLSLFVFWVRRRSAVDARGKWFVFLSWALDAGPIVMLGACAALYFAYQPFARTYQAYFSTSQPIGDLEGLMEVGMVTHVLPNPIMRFADPVLGWTVATVALSLMAALLLIRMVARRLRHA